MHYHFSLKTTSKARAMPPISHMSRLGGVPFDKCAVNDMKVFEEKG